MATVATPFFPLDEELNLAPGSLTPRMQEGLVRLGSQLPFRRAAELFDFFMHCYVCEATARRTTQAAGATYQTLQTQLPDVAQVEPPLDKLLLSVDGAFVPLVGGKWAEVKSLAVGNIDEPQLEEGQWVVHSSQLSYFSRLSDATTFSELAGAELARRNIAQAGQVCAVSDGAAWIQGIADRHCPEAVRILDFMHAAGYLAQAAQAFFGADSAAGQAWFDRQRQELKHGTPQRVLDELLDLSLRAYDATYSDEAQETLHQSWSYLSQRRRMIAYAQFQQAGYPIGSGVIESGHKQLVQQRLKGAGMHWAVASVNPMLALTNLTANQRWAEAWPAILRHRRLARSGAKPAAGPALTTAEPPPEPPTPKAPYRPPADHPWRKPFLTSSTPRPAHTPK